MLAAGTNPAAVAGHIGDTIEVMSRVYAHWLPDDRAVPAHVLSGLLKPQLEVVQGEVSECPTTRGYGWLGEWWEP